MSSHISEAQLRTIYASTVDALYGYASRKCGGERELAEDVTQEVWLRAVREWPRTGAPDNPLAWLTTVARNLLINHYRKKQGVPLDSVSPEEILAAVEDGRASDSAEIASIMTRAMTLMPASEAELLEAFHYERKKVSQLAVVYGTTERAIEGRLRRARERLRTVLAESTSAVRPTL
ncbi:MAG: sigma-70 family RNA polymerase sigma factor [Gemmatimonas sp.]